MMIADVILKRKEETAVEAQRLIVGVHVLSSGSYVENGHYLV